MYLHIKPFESFLLPLHAPLMLLRFTPINISASRMVLNEAMNMPSFEY